MKDTIVCRNGVTRKVKNLGWLLRNWQDVVKITVTEPETGAKPCHWDCILTAELRGGGYYKTGWADRGVCRDWLRRPVFKGAPLEWFGTEEKC